MPKLDLALTHFNTGVVSQETLGRVDSNFYLSSLQECDNGILTIYGNVKKRQGTKYIAKINCEKIKFIPFIYSATESYILVLCMSYNGVAGDDRIYFLTKDSYVVDSSGNPYYICFAYYSVNDDLDKIQYIQKDDVIYLALEGYNVYKLKRNAENDWSVSRVSFNVKYIVAYGDGTSTEVIAYLPTILLKPSNVNLVFYTGGNENNVIDDGAGNFTGTNITKGTIDYNTGRLYLKVSTAFDSDTPVKVYFINYGDLKPGSIAFYENRLILGAFDNAKQVFMSSVTGSYEDIIFGDKDNNSYIYEIASKENNEIVWMYGRNTLLIGTVGAEYSVYGGSNGITPTSIMVKKQSEYGSAKVNPIILDDAIIFTQLYRKKIYAMGYDWQINGYRSKDLNYLNEDILNNNVMELAQEKTNSYNLWALLSDGTIALLLYDSNQGILGWHKYTAGGDGSVVTMASIPSKDGDYSKIYMVVERNGVKYIESTDNPEYDNYFDTVFVDCAMVYNVTTATNTFNVPYSDGDIVSVFTKEGVHKDVTVSNGQVVLDWDTTQCQIGYEYDFIFKTVPLEIITSSGFNTIGKSKSIDNMVLQLYKSNGGYVGLNDYYQLIFRTPQDLMDNAVPLYSGTKKISIFNSVENSIYISIKHKQPTPFNLIGISLTLNVGEV